jgi:parvulin-like peptidyl-prolyl isomerase
MARSPRFAVGIVVSVWSLTGLAASADDPAGVVARLGEETILRKDVDAFASRVGLDAVADEAQRQRVRATVLEQLIDERAVRAELTRLGLGVEPDAVETAIDRLRQQVTAQGKNWSDFLAASGKSLESLREQVALELAVQAYVRPRITSDALNRVFEQNQRELDGTRLRVSHVVLRPNTGGSEAAIKDLIEQAETIRQEVVQGRVSFAEAAARWSAGPSRREGGDLGWVTREGPLIESFTSVVYKLPKGGVSEPFVTPSGVHLATVTAVETGRVGPTAVRSRLERILASELVRGLVVEGRRRAGVTFSAGVPHLEPATLGEPNERREVVVLESAD